MVKSLYRKARSAGLGQEELLFPKRGWDDREEFSDYYAEQYRKYEVGMEYYTSVGAPGIGGSTYVVTRKDAKGVWGRLVESNVGELEEFDVR